MDKLGDQIIKVMNDIAAKLGVAANMLYPILRKQAIIDGVVGLFMFVLFATITAVCVKELLKAFNGYYTVDTEHSHYSTHYVEDPKYILHGSIASVVGGLSLIIAICYASWLPTAITAILNPDWYIMRSIVVDVAKALTSK